MRNRRLFSMFIALALLGRSAPASADDAMTDTARDLFVKAVKAAGQQKWDQCRAALLAALAIKEHPQVAGNLAGCELKLKLYRDAAEHLAYFLRELKPDAPPEKRAIAEEALHDAQAKIETVRLTVSLPDADVRVDGRTVGRSPLPGPIFVDPGPHTIEAFVEGFPEARATIDAQAGGARDLTLALKKEEPLPPPPLPVKKAWKPGAAFLVTGGVLAVGGLAAGIGLAVAANGKSSTADSLRATVGSNSACAGAATSSTSCAALLSDLQSRDSLTKGAFASFMLGGAFALATAGLGVWTATASKDQKDAPAIRVVPVVGRDEGGLIVLGSF